MKVYLLNLDNLLIGNASSKWAVFSANLVKIWYRKLDPVLYREKALYVYELCQNCLLEFKPGLTFDIYSEEKV